MSQSISIQGHVSPGYEAVAEAFLELFQRFGEIGASVSLQHYGETVVDVWAGTRDKQQQLPWQQDTRSNIFSASKGIVALAVLQLVERGALALDQPIAEVWPEFAQSGKGAITLRQVLTHRSGMNAFHERIADEHIYDWPAITELVAAEKPWWQPGSEQGYSPMIYGWLLGELVRRVSGFASFNDYVQAEIVSPLGACLSFGVNDAEQHELADVTPLKVAQSYAEGSLIEAMRGDPRGVVNRAFVNPPTLMTGTNSAAWRSAQIPAANGHASAACLAVIYGSLANLDDNRLLGEASRHWCWQEQSYAQDKLLNNPISFSLGFMRLLPKSQQSQSQGQQQFFCHPGAGGSLGYGDASDGIGFGYVSRSMGQSILMDLRAEHLLAAVYAAVKG